jgi:hypothetical protein
MLKTTTWLLVATIFNLSINTSEASAMSKKQCRRAQERIIQSYTQNQPSPLNTSAYQRWANSLMNAIAEFEEDNPECPKSFKNGGSSGGLTTEQQQQLDELFNNQLEEDGKFRVRRYCQAHGRRYKASTNSWYD